jgi:plastocyanin
MKRRTPIFVAAVLALAAFAGCGSSSKTTSTQATRATGGSSGGVVAVSMKTIQFVPKNVTAKVGQKITWTNDDPVAHTVTAQRGADFDSGTVNSGGTFSFTPKKAGTIAYVCTIHPGQSGTITVTK